MAWQQYNRVPYHASTEGGLQFDLHRERHLQSPKLGDKLPTWQSTGLGVSALAA